MSRVEEQDRTRTGMTRQGAVKLANEMLKAKRLGWTASCDKKDDGIFVTLAKQHGGQVPWSLCECGCLCACLNPHYVKTADADKMRFIVEHLIKDICRASHTGTRKAGLDTEIMSALSKKVTDAAERCEREHGVTVPLSVQELAQAEVDYLNDKDAEYFFAPTSDPTAKTGFHFGQRLLRRNVTKTDKGVRVGAA